MCSWVKPMAPIDWCDMEAMRWANSEAWLLAAAIEKRPPSKRPPSSASRAAASAEAMVAATQLASSASMCWMAWKVEIDRPNCTRCLEYSTAVASTLSAAPAICMARVTAASSNARSALTAGELRVAQRRGRRTGPGFAAGRGHQQVGERGLGERHRHGVRAGEPQQRQHVGKRAAHAAFVLRHRDQRQAHLLDLLPEIGGPGAPLPPPHPPPAPP